MLIDNEILHISSLKCHTYCEISALIHEHMISTEHVYRLEWSLRYRPGTVVLNSGYLTAVEMAVPELGTAGVGRSVTCLLFSRRCLCSCFS